MATDANPIAHDTLATGSVNAPAPRVRLTCAALLVVLTLAYTANRRSLGAGDVTPATLLSVAIARGDGLVLDRFERLLRTPDGRLPGYTTEWNSHIVSRYPIGPALLAAPLVMPQAAWLDATQPGWERQPAPAVRRACLRMAKNAAALMTASSIVLVYLYLLDRNHRRAALPVALAAALGTGCLSVASQALWQHGPAILCLSLAMLCLRSPSAPRAALAGAAAAMLVVCRPVNAVYAAAVAAWVVTHLPRRLRLSFFIPALLLACMFIYYNLSIFHSLTGGYSDIERMHPWAHGTRGTFTGSIIAGGLGTLFSPSHGLFVYWPWTALALAGLASSRVRSAFEKQSLERYLLASLVLAFALLATYSCWWGGHCFGPRFWIDAVPIFALAAAPALECALDRPVQRTLWTAAIIVSVLINGVGFATYPTSWHRFPSNADRDHARLWDWRDNEITRGIAEGLKPPAW